MGFSKFRTRVYATNERGLLDVLAFEVSWESMPQTNLRVQASPAVEVPGCTGASAWPSARVVLIPSSSWVRSSDVGPCQVVQVEMWLRSERQLKFSCFEERGWGT